MKSNAVKKISAFPVADVHKKVKHIKGLTRGFNAVASTLDLQSEDDAKILAHKGFVGLT